jgi:hypothetical protein
MDACKTFKLFGQTFMIKDGYPIKISSDDHIDQTKLPIKKREMMKKPEKVHYINFFFKKKN